MKCELCHKADAQTAITLVKKGEEQELYVCKACAKAENERRKTEESEKGDGNPDEIIGGLINFFDTITDGIIKIGEAAKAAAEAHDRMVEFPIARIPTEFRYGDAVHLEGLFILGELDAVKRAMRALDIELVGINIDRMYDAGHAYIIRYGCDVKQVKRVIGDLLREEKNARVRILQDRPWIFEDTIYRALALLKNCRLLSSAELFDLVSPLKLAIKDGLIRGISERELNRITSEAKLIEREDIVSPEDMDQDDLARAEKMNRRFRKVNFVDIEEAPF